MKILFVGYGFPEASSRFRIEQILDYAKNNGIHEWSYFPIKSTHSNLLIIILRKILSLALAIKYDAVFIQRNPVKFMSPYYEWTIKYILRKKIIYDFDDAMWLISGRFNWTIPKVIKLADLVIVGNANLRKYAKQFNKNIKIFPTLVNADDPVQPNIRNNRQPIICWVGSGSSNKFLEDIEEALLEITHETKGKAKFIFVSDKRPRLQKLKFEYVPWNVSNEKNVLAKADIGLMPLRDTEMARGKCGFKLLLYGINHIALVASPVGVNKDIILPDNGLLASTKDDWVHAIMSLLDDKKKLSLLKTRAFTIVSEKYTVQSQFDRFEKIIESV